jgi:hypothetical protein
VEQAFMLDPQELLRLSRVEQAFMLDPQELLRPSRGGAGIYACGSAVEEISFSR